MSQMWSLLLGNVCYGEEDDYSAHDRCLQIFLKGWMGRFCTKPGKASQGGIWCG